MTKLYVVKAEFLADVHKGTDEYVPIVWTVGWRMSLDDAEVLRAACAQQHNDLAGKRAPRASLIKSLKDQYANQDDWRATTKRSKLRAQIEHETKIIAKLDEEAVGQMFDKLYPIGIEGRIEYKIEVVPESHDDDMTEIDLMKRRAELFGNIPTDLRCSGCGGSGAIGYFGETCLGCNGTGIA